MVRSNTMVPSTFLVWILLQLATSPSAAFLTRVPVSNDDQQQQQLLAEHHETKIAHTILRMSQESETSSASITNQELDVVLFGVGDLRMDDHDGLYQALHRPLLAADGGTKKQRKILPLVILDDACLSNIPGVVSHTIDTANMLLEALEDLKEGLQNHLGLELQVVVTSQQQEQSTEEALQQVLEQHANGLDATNIRVHVHDLGDADNGMNYGPYSQLQSKSSLSSSFEMVPWTANLRNKPWTMVDTVPDRYPDFASKFADQPMSPVPTTKISAIEYTQFSLVESTGIPTPESLVERIASKLQLDPKMMKAESNTGMFQTHWGGLDSKSVGESQVLENLNVFVHECQEDDNLWVQHPQFVAKGCPRNERSLEHATYEWFLNSSGSSETNNLLAGESMTRYLAAPLLLGTVSPRRIWHMATRQQPLFVSPLKTLVEGREWHNIFAAKNIRTRPEYQADQLANAGETTYGYWRWHGFLCRYAQTPLISTTDNSNNKAKSKEISKEGVLFFHGFGASGTQWNKAYQELSTILTKEDPASGDVEGLAPDLLGFGESEKPPISYSIYVWDALCTDFVKDVAIAKRKWDSYIVGGNSIGGFSAASTAANECVPAEGKEVCSSGAPGTAKCQGVVLMNPAGPIKSREDAAMENEAQLTVAQICATGALPPCKAPPRPIGRILGNALLAYLRPSIQSICVNLYPTNPSAVDDALCQAIDRDSVDPGAINVMISGAKLPPPRSMNEMLQADFGKASKESIRLTVPEASFGGPVLVSTGVLDPLNDAQGRSEGLAALRAGIKFDPINAGHCPHDELPKEVATSIAKWRSTTIRPRNLAAVNKASAVPIL